MADQEAKTKTIGYLPVEKAQSLAGLLKTTAPAGNIETLSNCASATNVGT